MHRSLHHLNCRIIPHLHARISRQRHLRQTKSARIRILRRSDDLEDRHHGERHVWGLANGFLRDHGRFAGSGVVGSFGAEAHVYVEESGGVTLEPAGLDRYSAAIYGPFGAVGGGGHAAARIYPLHPKWPTCIRNQIISPPSWIRDDRMCLHHQRHQT